MLKLQKIDFEPVADPKAIILIDKIRFTILTSRIIRLEYSKTNSFEDRASQVFWFRKQSVPKFELIRSDGYIEVKTEYLHLRYRINDEGFTKWSLS
ncbi:MAG: alpha-xylosidase, partial [Candidatus Hermodarchaeota archaeon]